MPNMETAPLPEGGMNTARLENLADGVVGIAMTLLVLDLQPPAADAVTDAAPLSAHLLKLGPAVFSYGLSFLALAVLWMGHHIQLHFVRRASRPYLWLNVLFLAFVAAVPFAAKLMSRFPHDELAVGLYGLLLAWCGLLSAANWVYATWERHLVASDFDAALAHAGLKRTLLAPAIYLGALLFLPVASQLTMGLYVLAPLVYLWPSRRIDRDLAPVVGQGGSA